MHEAQWLSWLERRPVTAEAVGSSPIWVVCRKLKIWFLADVAQLAEQLICNQQVIGSSPIIGFMDGFPSGQRGQTVNLLATPSVVRIHRHPL